MSEHVKSPALPLLPHPPAGRLVRLAAGLDPWLVYLGTTGLPAMDYRLTDEWVDPVGLTAAQHTETLVRTPGGLCASHPNEQFPAVQAPPFLRKGCITFGSLNSLRKLNADFVTLWTPLLKAVPGSRLLLQAKQFADRGTLGRWRP